MAVSATDNINVLTGKSDPQARRQIDDNYQDFLKVTLSHPDLKLFSPLQTPSLNDEQRERMFIIFSMLMSLFERAYLLLYEDDMTPKQLRRWRSWEDYMHEWCQRADFRATLPLLLRGEDPDFVSYLQTLAANSDNPQES